MLFSSFMDWKFLNAHRVGANFGLSAQSMRYFVVNMRKGKYLSFLLYFYCYCDCYCCYLFFVKKVKSKKLAAGGWWWCSWCCCPCRWCSRYHLSTHTSRYHPDERKWWMTLVNDPNVWAVSNASMKSLIMGRKYGIYWDWSWQLFTDYNIFTTHMIFTDFPSIISHSGRHLWTIYNDLDCTGEEAVLALSLTTCTDDQVFVWQKTTNRFFVVL